MSRSSINKRNAQVLQVIEVLRLLAEGKKASEACAIVGIPESTYRKLAKLEESGLQAFRTLVQEDALNRLGMTLLSQAEILQTLIKEGKDITTKTSDRISIYKLIVAESEKIANQVRLNEATEDSAVEVLGQGPKLRPSQSRLTARVTLTLEQEPQQPLPGSVAVSEPVLDLAFRDSVLALPEGTSEDSSDPSPE